MNSAEDASSALPPMGHPDDDELDDDNNNSSEDAPVEDDAVAFAVAAIEELDDDAPLQNNNDLELQTYNEDCQHGDAQETSASAHVMSYGATSAAANARNHYDDSVDSESAPMEADSQTTRKRARRVGRTNRRRHEELLQAAAAAASAPPSLEQQDTLTQAIANSVISSKHDEKWNVMFQKLVDYKQKHGNTLVPQCHHDDPKLGRWVHYQRVEYWLFQSTGQAKITAERIQRLQDIQFEWDPQREKWNNNYEKLLVFHQEHGHCRVPKNWVKDPELANWVRNQRLEYTNRQKKGRTTRMTQDRLDKLNKLGFTWSLPTKSSSSKASAVDTGTNTERPQKRQKTVDATATDNNASAATGVSADAKENELVENDATDFDAAALDALV